MDGKALTILMTQLLNSINEKDRLYQQIDDLQKQIDSLDRHQEMLLDSYSSANRTTVAWILGNCVRINGIIYQFSPSSRGMILKPISLVEIENINDVPTIK